MKAPILLAFLGLATAQAAEPTGTVTLACQGEKMTTSLPAGPLKDPVSMGIIVDLTARTVNGLDSWSNPIPITSLTETIATFEYDEHRPNGQIKIYGWINRVTGDMNASIEREGKALRDEGSVKSGTLINLRSLYTLKCKPTQRMF
jgi:hypothetical protein